MFIDLSSSLTKFPGHIACFIKQMRIDTWKLFSSERKPHLKQQNWLLPLIVISAVIGRVWNKSMELTSINQLKFEEKNNYCNQLHIYFAVSIRNRAITMNSSDCTNNDKIYSTSFCDSLVLLVYSSWQCCRYLWAGSFFLLSF